MTDKVMILDYFDYLDRQHHSPFRLINSRSRLSNITLRYFCLKLDEFLENQSDVGGSILPAGDGTCGK